jgi:hypothetical protein
MARWITINTSQINTSGEVTVYLSVGTAPIDSVPVGAGGKSVFRLGDNAASGTVTEDAPGDEFWTQGATGPYFVDPDNLGTGVAQLRMVAEIYAPSSLASAGAFRLFNQGAGDDNRVPIVFEASTYRVRMVGVRADGGAYPTLTPSTGSFGGGMETLAYDQWNTIDILVDMVGGGSPAITATLNGSSAGLSAVTIGSNTGTLRGAAQWSMLAETGGGSVVPSGLRVRKLELYKNGSGTAHKSITGDATDANADAWKTGGEAT